MKSKSKQNQLFQTYRNVIHAFPLKVKMFIGLLFKLVQVNVDFQLSSTLLNSYSTFSSIFRKLQAIQKNQFILSTIQHIILIQNNKRSQFTNVNIQTSCQLKIYFFGISYWQKRNFKLNSANSILKLQQGKKQELFDLKNYLVRKSKSQKQSIVLQYILNDAQKYQKITIRFNSGSVLKQIYLKLKMLILQLTKRQLQALIKQDQRSSDGLIKQNRILTKDFTILTSKAITQYFKFKQKSIQILNLNRKNSTIVFQQDNFKLYQCTFSGQMYYVDYLIKTSDKFQQLKNKIPFLDNQKQQNIIYCQKLQIFAQSISANYYKFKVNKQELEWVVMQQRLQKNQTINITIKTATNFYKKVSIQFMQLTFKKIHNDEYKLLISSIVKSTSKNLLVIRDHIKQILQRLITIPDQNTIKNDIYYKSGVKVEKQSQIDLDQVILNKQIQIKNQEQQVIQEYPQEQFYTILSIGSQQERQIEKLKQCYQQIQIKPRKSSMTPRQILTTQVESTSTYLKKKHIIVPKQQIPQKIYVKQHFLWKQFKIGPKGGVVLCDQQLLDQQKQILKLVLTRIGNNILKRQSIMNISLPIQLFSNESTLTCIARNFTYVPLILANIPDDPVQRMKKICLIQISMAALAIDAKKPFNPILGQTYQGLINGCPIFLQQISHHPPISYLYFIGRGFKIYGGIIIQVCLRLNYLKGISIRDLTIQFDDGDRYLFDIPTMCISNLILGQRYSYFQGQNYIFNQQHNLVSQINFNVTPAKRSIYYKKNTVDYFFGQIYKATSQFINKKYKQKKQSPKKQNQNQSIVSLEGEWLGKIYIDQKLIIDLGKDLPLQLQSYQYAIPSDSTLRHDLILLNTSDIMLAQQEKDRMENIQRRDKRLRQSYSQTQK